MAKKNNPPVEVLSSEQDHRGKAKKYNRRLTRALTGIALPVIGRGGLEQRSESVQRQHDRNERWSQEAGDAKFARRRQYLKQAHDAKLEQDKRRADSDVSDIRFRYSEDIRSQQDIIDYENAEEAQYDADNDRDKGQLLAIDHDLGTISYIKSKNLDDIVADQSFNPSPDDNEKKAQIKLILQSIDNDMKDSQSASMRLLLKDERDNIVSNYVTPTVAKDGTVIPPNLDSWDAEQCLRHYLDKYIQCEAYLKSDKDNFNESIAARDQRKVDRPGVIQGAKDEIARLAKERDAGVLKRQGEAVAKKANREKDFNTLDATDAKTIAEAIRGDKELGSGIRFLIGAKDFFSQVPGFLRGVIGKGWELALRADQAHLRRASKRRFDKFNIEDRTADDLKRRHVLETLGTTGRIPYDYGQGTSGVTDPNAIKSIVAKNLYSELANREYERSLLDIRRRAIAGDGMSVDPNDISTLVLARDSNGKQILSQDGLQNLSSRLDIETSKLFDTDDPDATKKITDILDEVSLDTPTSIVKLIPTAAGGGFSTERVSFDILRRDAIRSHEETLLALNRFANTFTKFLNAKRNAKGTGRYDWTSANEIKASAIVDDVSVGGDMSLSEDGRRTLRESYVQAEAARAQDSTKKSLTADDLWKIIIA
jgi:hypothetical protein